MDIEFCRNTIQFLISKIIAYQVAGFLKAAGGKLFSAVAVGASRGQEHRSWQLRFLEMCLHYSAKAQTERVFSRVIFQPSSSSLLPLLIPMAVFFCVFIFISTSQTKDVTDSGSRNGSYLTVALS